MRPHITIRAAALLAVSALALTACGGDDPTDAANREEKSRDAALAYTKCMRENGIDMPDPKPGEPGIRLTVPKGTSPGKVEAADKACRKYLEAVKPPELSEEQQKKFQQAALAQSRCMREHGIDMPDPTFDGNGGARIKIGKGSGIRPDDPTFEKAEEACRREAPGGLMGAGSTEEGP